MGRAFRLEIKALEAIATDAIDGIGIFGKSFHAPDVERGLIVYSLHQFARFFVFLHRHRNLAAQQLHAFQDIACSCGFQLLEIVLDDLGHPVEVRTLGRTEHATIVQLGILAERAGGEFLTLVDDGIGGSVRDASQSLLIVVPYHQRGDVPAHLASSVDHVVRRFQFQQL